MEYVNNILLPGEKPNADTMLKRMNEYDQCLITQDTNELVTMPVDFNPQNILPSNMARISKSFLEKPPVVVDYEMKYLFPGDVCFKVHFRSALHFYNYNRKVFYGEVSNNILSEKQRSFLCSEATDLDERFNGSALIELFWNLTTLHLKGIDKVNISNMFSMDWSAFQAFVMSDLEKKKSKSNIITPTFGY